MTDTCHLTWQNEFYIYGDSFRDDSAWDNGERNRLVSKVIGTKLTEIGKVIFYHKSNCDVMGSHGIYLCFNNDNVIYKHCRVASNPLDFTEPLGFNVTQESLKEHWSAGIAASDCKLGKITLIDVQTW